jgi:hypothetical protein
MAKFAYRSAPNEVAISTAVSTDLTKTGVFLDVFQASEKSRLWYAIIPASRAFQDLDYLLDGFGENIRRSHVDLAS